MKNISLTNLEQKGLVNISYPANLRMGVEKAVATWKAFCSLPEELKMKFPYGSDIGMGVGYELKKTTGANLDVKEDFHFAAGFQDSIKNIARSLHNETIIDFVEASEALVGLMEPLIIEFAGELESSFGLKNLRDEVVESKGIWFVRFLHYFGGRQVGDEIATPHADKSGFTLHLYESDPGLEYLDRQKQWRKMPVSHDETAIIPGMRLQYRSRNQLKATYHRVVATAKTAAQGRFSVVCFIHLGRTPEYNKKKAGRLQEFQPGFNYEMPFEEFAKLFI
jgi:isopenicillin N synthase-like dioxygenase